MKVFVRTRGGSDIGSVLALHARTDAVRSRADENIVIADLSEPEITLLRASSRFQVFDDVQFYPALPLSGGWWERQDQRPLPAGPVPWMTKTQKDVMEHIGAPAAWSRTRGEGVTIALVDTGVDGAMAEFVNRSPHSFAPSFKTPWEDSVGHGTMCAAIACGSTAAGGRYDGVAPAATLLSARSTLRTADLYLIYEHLLREHRRGNFPKGLVVSNSYALNRCTAPDFPQGHPYLELVRKCVAEGIIFVFAAGNNHAEGLCGFAASADGPSTIWAVNSVDEVITVGTVDWNESNQEPAGEHANSSRGPGQWSTRGDKPDLVAPTYGEVAWSGSHKVMEWWGRAEHVPRWPVWQPCC